MTQLRTISLFGATDMGMKSLHPKLSHADTESCRAARGNVG